MMKAELLLDTRCKLGEGAIWDQAQQRLLWVDIEGHLAQCYLPSTGTNVSIDLEAPVGTIVPSHSAKALAARGNGLTWIDFETGDWTPWAGESGEAKTNRLNDGKCDPQGRLWVGGLSMKGEKAASALYRVDPDGQWSQHVNGVTCSNGLVWDRAGTTFYYIDTPTRRVDAFDFDADTGTLANRRPAYHFPEGCGHPDGMTIDAADNLWVAMWDGARVMHVDPVKGELLGEITVPARRVTSCAFGGEELNRLYITTSRPAREAELEGQPHAGGLFVAETPVRGLPANAFAGA